MNGRETISLVKNSFGRRTNLTNSNPTNKINPSKLVPRLGLKSKQVRQVPRSYIGQI
jgi:hypothetical protein